MSSVLHEKILIPLDGSEFPQQTLVQLRSLLQRPGAHVHLLTAVDPVPFRHTLRPLRGQDDEVLDARLERARAHLEQVQQRLAQDGVATTVAVRQGLPAAVILEEVEAYEPTLVAMTTHGRSGLSEWVHGSVAQRVLRHCQAPLLLLRPQAEGPQELALGKILVALDGSERSARVLPLVTELAQLQGAQVVLCSAAWSEPGDSSLVYGQEIEEVSAEYGATHKPSLSDLRGAGVPAESLVEWGLPEQALPAVLEREQADLLALTTHGRTGVSRFLLGSVAEKLLRSTRLPVLLLRTAD